MKAELVQIPPIAEVIPDDAVPEDEVWLCFKPDRGKEVVMLKIPASVFQPTPPPAAPGDHPNGD
jgi:hypothetical protein